MKKRVELSNYCLIISVLIIVLIWGTFVYALKQPGHDLAVGILAGVMMLLFLATLFFMPLSISLDGNSLNVNRPLKVKSISISEISDVRLCPPTMGAIRICGSGGWFGWYGWFREGDLGKYFAYYGKSSECFLVRLRNGRRYMLGCDEPGAVVDSIKAQISVQSAC